MLLKVRSRRFMSQQRLLRPEDMFAFQFRVREDLHHHNASVYGGEPVISDREKAQINWRSLVQVLLCPAAFRRSPTPTQLAKMNCSFTNVDDKLVVIHSFESGVMEQRNI